MTQSPRLLAMRPLRHACHMCGTCCQGWRVHLIDQEERLRIIRQADVLGIADPILPPSESEENPRYMLRTDKGRCVFLNEENMCRIHGEFGSEEKPLVCQQFPRRVTRAEDGLRLGIDPACTSAFRSWDKGPEVQPFLGIQSTHLLTPDLVASEQGLLALLSQPDMTVARFVAILTNAPIELTELPVGFVGRVIASLRIADLPPFFEDPSAGKDVLYRVSHLPEFLRSLDPMSPPSWAGRLTPDLDAYSLEVLRRVLFVRLGDQELPPIAQVLLHLIGFMVCAWADPNEESYPEALSAWIRLSRIRGFWARLMPETENARWILFGDGQPAAPAEPTAPAEP